MKNKKVFRLYTGMWIVAILLLLALLWQSLGDARIINYSGLVRGATQRLVKEELNGERDDALIRYIDDIIQNLQTGKGEYNLQKNSNKDFQWQLDKLKLVWETMKREINTVREGQEEADKLFDLSQKHFEMADRLVLTAEQNSNSKLIRFIVIYLFSLIVSVTVFHIVNRKNQKDLENSISIDKLTGLLSRAGFEEKASGLLRQHPKTEYVIIEFDIDNFKGINYAYGYILGDRLLRGLGESLAKEQGGGYLCARIDADDFVLLSVYRENLMIELETILAQAVKEQNFLETFGGITFTFGAYRVKDNEEQIKTSMDKANIARKTAKSQAGQSIVWYDEQLQQKLQQENKYKERMHHGIAAGEFKMYLQPKITLDSMEFMGAEALVRWELPDGETAFPDNYIPLFEKSGAIADLDFYMLQQACMYMRERLNEGVRPFTISVNFSRVTLYQPMFYQKFLGVIDQCRIPHDCIEVEVTESAFNDIADAQLQLLSILKEEGFGVSMDDFGAGYSNLNMLSRLPIQIIKLDKEFMREADHNEKMKGIVVSAIEMAHKMGIRVVCEGVEKQDHITFLKEAGCDYAQGYYFSRPVPNEEFTRMYFDK